MEDGFMKRIAVLFTTLSLCSAALAQTVGSGPTVLKKGPTTKPQIPSGERYADQFSGGDLGAQINAAVASLASGSGVVKIRRGKYTWNTPVTVDPRLISIQGDGSPFVTITCIAHECLKLYEPTFSISQGGSVGGFTMNGNGTSRQIGMEAGGVVGEVLDDIVLSNFSGSDSIALLFNNSATGNGWMERTTTRKLRLENDTIGWAFQYNTSNPSAGSFGYSNLEAQCNGTNNGQACIVMRSGSLYHSRIVIFGNVGTGGTLISVPGAVSGADEMYSNVYNIFAEGTGTGLNVGSGGTFTGYGTVDLGGMTVTNANSASFSAKVRVIQGPTEVVNGDAGSFSNFLGTGNSATVFPEVVRDIGTPDPGFGFLMGKNISSAYVSIYSGWPNAFVILACPFNPPNFATCSSAARIDNGGNVHASGAFYPNGSNYSEAVRVVGDVHDYAAGDVLAIDTNSESRFVLTSTPYSTRVAGIYSTKPGVLGSSHAMDATMEKEVPLAVHGIVPCKVSGENGSIRPGDLLVSAATPGYAMKGTDREKMQSAVVGKALGALSQAKGIVPVLVTLQ
jgi:hypothetical protein